MMREIKRFILVWTLNMINSFLDVVCGLISLLTLTYYRPWWDFSFRCYASKLLIRYKNEQDID